MDIKIIGFIAEVTSSLLYTNTEESPVEAAFTFPIDDGSAVFSFEAEIEGRHIVAEIQETEQVGFYAPNFEEVEGAYWFGPVRPSIRPYYFLAAEKLKSRSC